MENLIFRAEHYIWNFQTGFYFLLHVFHLVFLAADPTNIFYNDLNSEAVFCIYLDIGYCFAVN